MTLPMAAPLHVLLVEDNAADARMVRELLADAHSDASLTHAAGLNEALHHLRRGGFHVVLLDLSLPDSVGADTFTRTRHEAPEAPIVVLTGLDDPTLASWAVREGAQDYLVKGVVDGEMLLRTLRHAVERHAAQSALSESESRFRQLVEAIREAFVMVDLETDEVQYVSRSWETIWGQPVSDARRGPRQWTALVDGRDQEAYQNAIATVAGGTASDVTVRLARPDGTLAWVRSRFFPVAHPPKVTRIAILAEDVTDARTRETQLLAAQRMEAVGRLAGGIAHDFNNLLTVILGSCSLLASDLEADHHGQAYLNDISTAARSAASLTSQLLAFSRQGVHQPQPLALNEVIDNSSTLLRRLIGADVDLHINLGDALPQVFADQGQVQQVLINLVANARDAMPRGGRIVVSTGSRLVSPAEATQMPGLAAGPFVSLSVTDSGSGIDPAIQSRVFEPFFTTKEIGKGTGLGLATVYGIIKQAHGWIGVSSIQGVGTTFTVLLPAISATPRREPAPKAPTSRQSTGSETILVVEDHREIRMAICEVLAKHGYRVLEAADGQAALRVAHEYTGTIDLLVTDVVMPGANGHELATALTNERPKLRVLYMSGYPNDVIGRHGVLDPSVTFLQKPFLFEGLLDTIRQLLDR